MRYWVGGTGNWSDTNHWASSSGGTSGASIPKWDDVVFDSLSSSGSYTVTCDYDVQCLSLTMGNPPSGTITLERGFYVFVVNGSVTLATNMVILSTYSPSFYPIILEGSGSLTTNGVSIPYDIHFFPSSNGTYTLQDDLTLVGADINHVAYGLDTNGKKVTAQNYLGNFVSAKTLTLGASILTFTGIFTLSASNNTTLNLNTGTINCASFIAPIVGSIVNAGTSTINITSGNGALGANNSNALAMTYYNVNLTGVTNSGRGDSVKIYESNTFNSLTISPNVDVLITAGTTQTVSTITPVGAPGNLIALHSSIPGTRFTFSMSTGTVNGDYLSLTDCMAIGGAVWKAGGHSVDNGNNLGWIFIGFCTLTTIQPFNIGQAGASTGGNILSNGNGTIIERGVVYSTNQTPTVNDTKQIASGTLGVFSATITGLAKGTQYYVRAYAINEAGVVYGAQYAFFTYGFTPFKRFYYKVYNTGIPTSWDSATWDVDAWDYGASNLSAIWSDDVISDPTYRTVLNGGAGQLVVRLGRKYDNFGEGNDVSLNNKVELWAVDSDSSAGTKLYTGYISAYNPVLDGKNEYVDVTLLGYVTEVSYKILKDSSSNTTLTYSGVDISYIMQDAINKYVADGNSNLSFTASSIPNVGSTVIYTFKHNTLQEVFDACVAMAPQGYFWYVDPATNVVNFRQSNLNKADHTFTIGKDISFLQTTKRIEDIVNEAYVIGGGNPNVFNQYSRTSSVNTYGKHEQNIQDGTVTDNSTSDYFAKSILDTKQNPETRTLIRIADSNGENLNRGFNIESIQVGDTMQIKNLNYGAKGLTLWDIAIMDTDVFDNTIQYTSAAIATIVSLTYNPDYVEIEASSRLPEVAKRLETLNRYVKKIQNQNLPSSPVTRVV